jgi:murein DD-endopeptidase MepM/ murein hydrolase activator NlpD
VVAPVGTNINAAADGVVAFSGPAGDLGNVVMLLHKDSRDPNTTYATIYSHNSRNIVQEGQVVRSGQHIAELGNTGLSQGPHLDFAISRHRKGVIESLDPIGAMQGGLSAERMAQMEGVSGGLFATQQFARLLAQASGPAPHMN